MLMLRLVITVFCGGVTKLPMLTPVEDINNLYLTNEWKLVVVPILFEYTGTVTSLLALLNAMFVAIVSLIKEVLVVESTLIKDKLGDFAMAFINLIL